MANVKKHLKRLYYILSGTAIFAFMSYFVIWRNLAEGDRMVAYFANIIMIMGMVIDDKIRLLYIYKKWENPFAKWRWLARRFDKFMDIDNPMSIKTSLYLFYIIALVTSHILMLNPDLNVSASTREYFTVIGYGLILLVAADKFTGTLKSNYREIEKIETQTDEESPHAK